jgi:general secretion pathway protein J
MGRGQQGFTLLEIIVVLAVLGMLMLGLAQGMRFGIRAWNAQAASVDANMDLDAVDRTLRGLIGQTDPTPSVPGSFMGGEHALAFVTRLPDGFAGQRTRAANALLTVDATHRLVLRWTPSMRTFPNAVIVPTETDLVDGVERLDIAYWRIDANGRSGWARIWAGPGLPKLVRLRIVFPPNDRRHWPDIAAATMLQPFRR